MRCPTSDPSPTAKALPPDRPAGRVRPLVLPPAPSRRAAIRARDTPRRRRRAPTRSSRSAARLRRSACAGWSSGSGRTSSSSDCRRRSSAARRRAGSSRLVGARTSGRRPAAMVANPRQRSAPGDGHRAVPPGTAGAARTRTCTRPRSRRARRRPPGCARRSRLRGGRNASAPGRLRTLRRGSRRAPTASPQPASHDRGGSRTRPDRPRHGSGRTQRG